MLLQVTHSALGLKSLIQNISEKKKASSADFSKMLLPSGLKLSSLFTRNLDRT